MARVKCKACGERYDYHEHGCCPECGAYNRPPQRNRVGADGVVHHISDTDFLENTAKRRGSQNGKVCFEREECYEDEARYGSRSPFDAVSTRAEKKKESSSAGRRKKFLVTMIVVILLINVLPILLTMCSVSGVFEELVDELFSTEVGWDKPGEEVASVDLAPDLSEFPVIAPGQTFLWWDTNACVTELLVNEMDEGTKVELTLWVEDPQDKPTICYETWSGSWVEAVCEHVSERNDDYYTYCFYLPDRLPGSESFVLFAGQTGGVWCRSKLPLTEGVDSAFSGDVTTMARFFMDVGEPFLWWNEEIRVEGADIVEGGSVTEILLTWQGGVNFDAPSIVYWNENGEQVSTSWYDEYGLLQDGQQYYRFGIADRMKGSDCWAVFTDGGSAEHGAVWVLLNG